MRLPHSLIPALLALLLALPATAEDRPPAGLLWNRSGLPATLPLQVRSPPGLDHVVQLSAPDSGQSVFSGYVRGGAFFRVLVPPGDWRVSIVSGRDWQGDDALFGPQTQRTSLPQPLHFGVAEGTRLEGHVLWLDDSGDRVGIATVAPQTICRLAGHQSVTRDLRDDEVVDSHDLRHQRPDMHDLRARLPQRAGTQALSFDRLPAPRVPRPPLRYLDRDISLRSVFCD